MTDNPCGAKWYSGTVNNRHSEERTNSLQWTNVHLLPTHYISTSEEGTTSG